MSANTIADVHKKLADSIAKEYPSNSKPIKIKLQTFLLIMMPDDLKCKEKIIIVSLH